MAERLTFDGNFCEIARCRETRWGKHCPDGACSQRKVWERLKQYEEYDAVPVVRCRECKYGQDKSDGYPHEECRWGHGETPDANDFCSYGTRKDGDAADGLASVAETRFVYCPNCGARMDGGSDAKES